MPKRLIYGLSAFGLWSFRGLFRLLPHETALALGAWVGGMVYHLFPHRREIALRNLAESFPDLPPEDRERTARRVFRNFGRTGAEFLRSLRLRPADVARLVETDGLPILDEALAGGKGALLITAHFGNWELMARHLTDRGYKLSVVARDANDRRTNEMVNEIRRDNGYEVFSRGNAARFILERLRRNEFVGILPDQNAADVFVEFFGRTCGSVTGPAVIHLRTGSPIIPIFDVRLPDNRHRIEVKPPLETRPTGNADEDARRIMGLIHGAIEKQVRAHPDQWLWFHDRWKSARAQREPIHAG